MKNVKDPDGEQNEFDLVSLLSLVYLGNSSEALGFRKDTSLRKHGEKPPIKDPQQSSQAFLLG